MHSALQKPGARRRATAAMNAFTACGVASAIAVLSALVGLRMARSTRGRLYCPAGYPVLSPYLVVHRASSTIAWMVSVLNATEIRKFASPDGRIFHAELRIADSVIMIGEPADGAPPSTAHVHVYVPDVRAAYKRALAVAGSTSVQEPAAKNAGGDTDTRAGVKDPGGTTWWMATAC